MLENVCKLPREVVELSLKEGFPASFFVPWGVYVLLEVCMDLVYSHRFVTKWLCERSY